MTILTAARTLVIGLAVLGAAGPLRAGTIEVLVREAGGGAVPGQTVVLSPATPGERPDNGRGYVHSARLQQTAQDGIARLTAVALGTWRVSVKPTDPAFIDPSDLQGEGVQIVTIAHEEDRLRVELSLARGVRLDRKSVV